MPIGSVLYFSLLKVAHGKLKIEEEGDSLRFGERKEGVRKCVHCESERVGFNAHFKKLPEMLLVSFEKEDSWNRTKNLNEIWQFTRRREEESKKKKKKVETILTESKTKQELSLKAYTEEQQMVDQISGAANSKKQLTDLNKQLLKLLKK